MLIFYIFKIKHPVDATNYVGKVALSALSLRRAPTRAR
jgi:hypothetical protein